VPWFKTRGSGILAHFLMRVSSSENPAKSWPNSWLSRLVSGASWRALRDHVGAFGWHRDKRIASAADLRRFLESRASYVAQTSLYGYLRARSGARFPELFANDNFLTSINIAKWPIWLACLSDLSIFAGGLLAQRSGASQAEVAGTMDSVVDAILVATGVPHGATPEFLQLADQVRSRVRACEWSSVPDDSTPFTESPEALVRWSPVVDEYKDLDRPIVVNSVRFGWQDVRRDLRRLLDAKAVLGAAS
jgi:hypothetical protein